MLSLLKIGFATFAVSVMITSFSGPFGIFERTREWVKAKAVNETVHDGIECPFCIGFWVSLVFAIGYQNLLMWLPGLGLAYVGIILFKLWLDYADYVDHVTGRNVEIIDAS